jgi:hypothetical protein
MVVTTAIESFVAKARRREATIARRQPWLERQDRKQARKTKWERRRRIEAGLPLVDDESLQGLGADE